MPLSRTAFALLAGGALAAAAPARAAVTLELATLTAGQGDSGWHLRFELTGSTDVTSATLKPPGGSAFAIPCEALDEGGTACEFESAAQPSLAALLAVYPSGDYLLSLNGGARTASLAFDPVAPDGLATATSPADGAALVSPTPTITWTHDCTNCVALGVDIVEITAPFNIGLEVFVIGFPVPSPGSVTYAELESYEGPKPSFLPDGRYALTLTTAVGSITTEHLAPGGDAFEYTTAGLRDARTEFTVPEPGGAAAALATTAALAGIGAPRRRRRG